MKKQYWIVVSLIGVALVLALTLNAANGRSASRALSEEVHAGTFEEPRLISEPAWKGAVFLDTDAQPPRFYIAAFDSQPETPNPVFPDEAESNQSWTYAGVHSGLGPDLKPFTEPTRVDALHLAQIDGKKALLRSKIDGLPTDQTPYPTTAESNDFWDFIGFFEKTGTDADMKTEQDLVWPGVFMERQPDKTVYVALRTGYPAADGWPAPDSQAGAGYWKFAGTQSGIVARDPRPWVDRSTRLDTYYRQPVNAVRNYYWRSKFIGFPALLNVQFPAPGQSDDFWSYQGRHSGARLDPKAFGEIHYGGEQYRARIEGKWVVLRPRFEGNPSAETPFPVELKPNEFWTLGDISVHGGTWQNPKNDEDNFAYTGDIYSQQQSGGRALYRSLSSGYAPDQGWNYSDTQKWQPLGISVHAGTVSDPKLQTEFTWPGAVHATVLDGQPVYFASMVEGIPADHDWLLPEGAASNAHWTLIPEVKPIGTFEQPRQFEDYSQPGSVYVDNVGVGQRRFYISHFEGYPADDIDSFSMAGEGDPNWQFVGRHSGLMTDLKPFDDITRVGAFHDAMIAGKDRAVLRSLFDGLPSADTPYPRTPASTAHWEFIGIFKHSGTGNDLKGRDELTWPGALHLDEAQQMIYAAKKSGVPESEGWAYPVGNTSDDNWDYVASVANNGTAESPRERNSLSTPGTIFADQRGLMRQKLYRSKFSGFAKDVGAVYPSGSESNRFYDYLGEHAGTFADPKPFTEPTWPGAIHQTTIDRQLVFFKAKFEGAPGPETPFPETLSSNENWDFEFTTAQAGTYVDPKDLSGATWPGAIHEYKAQGAEVSGLYMAQQQGSPEADGWPNPDVPTAGDYWKFIGRVLHKGTFADPKQFTEATGVGLIHATTIDGALVYFRSLVNGDPADNHWTAPETESGNESWEYIGRNEPAGTWDDPKGANDFTHPGLLHAVRLGDKRVYLVSKVDGLPAEHAWPLPESGENAYWSTAGESRHSGDFANPKDQQEVTWVGAIHMKQDAGSRRYYRAKFAGNLTDIGGSHPLPEGESNNADWEYVGKNSNAGTVGDPHVGVVLTWPGNVHKMTRDTTEAYYLARFIGIADTSHPYPATMGASNGDWAFVGKSSKAGTVLEPKDEHEITWPEAVHRFERDGEIYYVKSQSYGVPPESGWEFPVPPNSHERWKFADIGVNAGTWSDPKIGEDPTWPGAIHAFRATPNGIYQYQTFFRSKFWGKLSDVGSAIYNPDSFELIGYSLYLGTLESPKFFDQPTWVGAIHFDRLKSRFFEAKKSGEMGIDVGPHPETATDNDSWRYLGEQKNTGTLDDPKEWTEYTWPGRIHNYDIGRTVLYFSAKTTGTPSDPENMWYYPTDESSDDHWAYIGRTEHAGTFGEPHEWGEITWRGAIHRVTSPNNTRYFAAQFAGSGEQNGWNYPAGESSDWHWKYIATESHAGTIEDPKDHGSDPVWPGAIVIDSRDFTNANFYKAKNDGIPANNDWPLPAGRLSDENWDYFGFSSHTGDRSDPKRWDEVTWPSAHHQVNKKGRRMLFSPRKAGIASEEGWAYPTTTADDVNWIFKSAEVINGTIEHPKPWNHFTEPGMIHQVLVKYQRMLFASKFEGQADPPDRPSDVPAKVYPDGAIDNQWWGFVRKGDGTAEIPNGWHDYSLVGDINEYFYGGRRLLFGALKEGKPSNYGRWYPTAEVDNDNWTYLYEHAGTFADPKQWYEWTDVGDIHRSQFGNQTLFFKAKYQGYPSRAGWHYPTTPVDNKQWTYRGLHAGTRQDPKTWSEPTWPGAIHWYREKNLYFESTFSGSANQHLYPVTAVSNAYWTLIDTNRFAANYVNDFSKPFDEYTWVTAHNAYIGDRGMVNTLRDHLNRGVRGFMLDVHMDNPENQDNKQVRVCHLPAAGACWLDAPLLRDAFPVFLEFLSNNRNAVISILFESTIQYKDMKAVLDQVPEVAKYSYNRKELLQPSESASDQWPTLQELIDTNKRLVMFSDNNSPGVYNVGDERVTIFFAGDNQVENTYNLGNTVITHDWACKSRYGDLDLSRRKADGAFNRLFVLNQFHALGSSTAHAGDSDNNLTWLQRRVERYCGEPTGWRKPNYLAIDFNQVGDAFPYAGALSQGGVYLYEGNNADRDRDTVCVLPIGQGAPGSGTQYDLDLPTRGCENDEIRSMELDGVSAGTRIEFYDHPQGSRQDDFTIIDVKQSVPLGQRVRINSLEGSQDTYWYRKSAFRNNGLDGKVSRIKIRTAPADDDFSDALVVFHEEVNASQNIVCSVPFNMRLNVKAKDNSYGCDNDEIDSATIVKAKAGSYFSVVGHPHGDYSQGLGEVRVKKDILMPVVIPNFESNFENDYVKVRRCRGDKLGGKISFLYFWPDGHALDCGE